MHTPWPGPILGTILVSFSMIFWSFFRYVFWITFGAILELFWEPKRSQTQETINQNSIEILVEFLKGSCTVFDRFWERFWDLGLSKMSVSPRRGAISEKITFFRSDSVWDIFLMNFGWFWEPFGHHFGTKVASKKRSKNRLDLRWVLD